MTTPLFRWLHLSDIHVGHGDAQHGWDQKFVMDCLRRDVAEIVKKDPIDAILVTGDVAFSGAGRSPDEYARAREWLLTLGKDTGLGAGQIFVVPGNHDVNRAVDKDRAIQRLVEGLREGRDKLDTALRDGGDRALLARRMAAYLEFAKDFAPGCLGAAEPPEQRLAWTHRMPARGGLAVRLLGLNTSLLAADDKDQGRLALGLEQLTRGLTEPAIEPHELVLALSHHPLRGGWLQDEKLVDARLKSHAHAHLSGHVHEADSEQARSGAGGTFVRVTAGAAHGDDEPGVPASHGYSFGEVALAPGGKVELRIRPRKWSPKNAAFRLDADNVPDGQAFAAHDVRLTLAASPGVKPLAPSVPAAGPLRIFISYAPADDALRAELETHLVMLRRNGLIESVSSADTGAGEEAGTEALRTAPVILLLISGSYLASQRYDEMEAAVARHDRGEARVIPILLRPCEYAGAPFAKLKMVPHPPGEEHPRPVTSFPGGTHDEAFKQIAVAIRAAVERLRKPSA